MWKKTTAGVWDFMELLKISSLCTPVKRKQISLVHEAQVQYVHGVCENLFPEDWYPGVGVCKPQHKLSFLKGAGVADKQSASGRGLGALEQTCVIASSLLEALHITGSASVSLYMFGTLRRETRAWNHLSRLFTWPLSFSKSVSYFACHIFFPFWFLYHHWLNTYLPTI